MNFFNKHYRSLNESYFQHLKFAFKHGCTLIAAGLAAIIHAICPFISTSFASRTTIALASSFKKRQPGTMGNEDRDRLILDHFISLMSDYITLQKTESVVHYLKPEEAAGVIDLNLSQEGLSDEDLVREMQNYLTYCVHTGHHQFLNQLWSGFDAVGVTAELLIALTNTSMYTYDVAPLATVIELALIRRLSDMLDFPSNSGGTFVTGGSNGNLVAMLAARNRCLARNHKPDDLCVIYSDNAHYSMDTAAMILGIKERNIFKIAHTADQAMSVKALDEVLRQIISLKKIPCFVAATAGTTVAGVFDPIDELAALTTSYPDCWLHVDAAHGGAVLFSAQYQPFLKGSERADSFVWDAHKTLGAPLMCSILLVKDQQNIVFHQEQSTANDYLYHKDSDHQNFDLGRTSIQCGRRADCLKLWLMWQRYGTSGIGSIVNHLMSLASDAEQLISKSDDLFLICKPVYLNLCFVYKPARKASIEGAFYYQVKKLLHTHEKTMVNIAKIEGQDCFRLVLTNKHLTKEDIDSFFTTLLHYCKVGLK
jgi:glutamate/tyrosine decarboxylase-like PLP-dependent enzyme